MLAVLTFSLPVHIYTSC